MDQSNCACAQLQLLTCVQMSRADQLAIEGGISSLELMESAGRAVTDVAIDMVPPGGRVVIMCGPGNNGGDGFVAARHLAARGRVVTVGLFGNPDRQQGDAAKMAGRFSGDINVLSPELLKGADLVIDAIFGAGLSRPIAAGGEIDRVFQAVATNGAPVLAVDVPSGLSGDNGLIAGAALEATKTVTFFQRKPGHLLMPGRRLCGEVVLADIGIPPTILNVPQLLNGEAPTWANAPALWVNCFPSLTVDGHKYHRGHTVAVSGSIEMSGAARLAARAALRIGSGLVTIAAPADAVPAHAAHLNAIMLAHGQAPNELRCLLEDKRKNSVVIGPGLGLGGQALDQVLAVLASSSAVVLDADALTAASTGRATVFSAIMQNCGRPVLLTPHEGEFSRLFDDVSGCVSGSKLERARAAAERCGGVVVLKGPDTVIATPDGRAAINENAPPWLATAGSGDVLSGMIAGLLAQGMPAFEAACAAVWLHGAAAAQFGRGLIAEDLVEMLPGVLQVYPFPGRSAG
jgi:hydroxyethylthiazole kinase-like uncharacterized protein yjeF